MQFQVLGPLRVIDDGSTEFNIRRPRERALLTVMLLHPGEVLNTAGLARMLWGDKIPADSGGALRTHIWSLRRLLAPADRLSHVAGGYRLELRPGELDVEEFRRLAAQGKLALDSGSDRDAAVLLTKALQLWREPTLADVPATVAMRGPVRQLTDQRRAAHAALVTAKLALGQHSDLVAELEAETSAHPEDEWYWERLMLGLYRSGRRAEALSAYRQVQKILAAEHGLDPGPSLQQMHQQILRDDPNLRWRAPTPGLRPSP
jgi:DNA-binding SARP family transcriptional activator